METSSKLFSPLQMGNCQLKHRVVHSPMTRLRADNNAVPWPMMIEYYSQRASVPGTLIIAEATAISQNAIGFENTPGIWNSEHIDSWKKIVDSVHSKDSFIWLQLWATGRTAQPGFNIVSSSAVQCPQQEGESDIFTMPRALEADEIQESILEYEHAAKNAMECGFDGVEIHGANGFLIDQFSQESCNKRTDEWGGSIENRARFILEVTKRLSLKIGANRVGMKLTPWSTYLGMGTMNDLVPQFEYIINRLDKMNIAYLHLANSRWVGKSSHPDVDNKTFVNMWDKSKPIILAGGYDIESARTVVENTFAEQENVCISFGRSFLSNPDLPFRVKYGIPIRPWNRETFYGSSEKGYLDYPFSKEFNSAKEGKD